MRRVALVLAAGAARRFGGDKLSAPLRGEPLLFHAIRAARAAPVERVVIVARPGLETGAWEGTPRVETLRLESAALSDSLRAGIAAAGDADGAFIFLGDMPAVPPDQAARLAALLGEAFAALPRHGGRPGHPVLLAARAFPEIAGLTGDAGAGRLLAGRADVVFDDGADAGIHPDVDRPQDLARLERDGWGG